MIALENNAKNKAMNVEYEAVCVGLYIKSENLRIGNPILFI